MTKALKTVFLSALRARGFKGSLPHLRRVLPERVDYVTVQFNSAGGSFVVELASAGPDGKPPGYGRSLPIEKLNVQYFKNRFRLGSEPNTGIADHWFEYGPRNYSSPQPARNESRYREVAEQVVTAFITQGEAWFSEHAGAA